MKIRSRRRQRGAMVLEFALSFLIFFTVVYAVMEFGRIVASYNMLAGATREATRYAAVHGSFSGSPASSSDVTGIVKKWAIGLDTTALTVTTTWPSGNGPGDNVEVQATYKAAPFTTLILPRTITLKSSSEMMISQ